MINQHYQELKASYLFRRIDQKVTEYLAQHPDQHLLRLGIGDVTQPLAPAVIDALHAAVDEQADASTFQGYQPEVGADFFKEAVAGHYAQVGVELEPGEIFVSSGASDDLGDILDIFEPGITVMVLEPAYPAYVDANIMRGNRIVRVPAGAAEGFTPLPPADQRADVVYICSPNNPTGAVFGVDALQVWVDWARETGAVIIFDAAYEAFITDPAVPHSIYQVPGAKECAIEISSFSKTAGFTGTRCGYTVVPKALVRDEVAINGMWVRNRTTKTNGISYILQKGAAAVFTPEGQAQAAACIEGYRANARTLMAALDRCGITYYGGENAPYIWMLAPDGMDSWELFDKLLNEAQIVGTPGSGFGPCGEGYFRLTAFGNPADTAEAAKRLVDLFA